jgi:hypothetical protein
MTVQCVSDLSTPIGEILQAVGPDGMLLESSGGTRYALVPLDDDLIDHLIERNPKLIEECRLIRERMHAGRFHTHDEIKGLLGDE